VNATLRILLIIVAPVVTGLVTTIILQQPITSAVTWVLLVCLLSISFSNLYDYHSLMKSIKPLGSVINSLIEGLNKVFDQLLNLPESRNITIKDFRNALYLISKSAEETYRKELFGWALESTPKSSLKEKRKRELLEKARKGELKYPQETEELKRLLEEQRKKRESEGDVFGAIMIGLLILFLLGLLASSSREK